MAELIALEGGIEQKIAKGAKKQFVSNVLDLLSLSSLRSLRPSVQNLRARVRTSPHCLLSEEWIGNYPFLEAHSGGHNYATQLVFGVVEPARATGLELPRSNS